MKNGFQANSLPLLIGSLPLKDHEQALRLVFEYTPDIPLWVQLPAYKEERMIAQFLPGMPGVTVEEDRVFIDTEGDLFNDDILKFYEEYMAVTEGEVDIDNTRFAMRPDTAPGFFMLLEHLEAGNASPVALKGQISGPVTFGIGLTDREGRAVFYNEQTKDVMVKLLALKAGWQVGKLAAAGLPVILFLDEPAMARFGSSEMISISREEITACLSEVIDAVHYKGGIAGIHVCANTDWSLILESAFDIVNFDAYSYFDRFILYADQIKKFFRNGGIIAWGIVPTSLPEDIERETTASLLKRWQEQMSQMEKMGIDRSILLRQSLITPSCGTGTLSPAHAERVLELTAGLSRAIRDQ
ncbi:MAG: hypothetical protein JRE58_02765 [Deltaproteobacteria bacterium]|nr:hypothetical protein [Deltaproteobacteria bacterium]